MYVHTGPVQRQHQHTDCICGHHTGVRVNYNNKIILGHFIINRTIFIFFKILNIVISTP
jgi:hypothetical protein